MLSLANQQNRKKNELELIKKFIEKRHKNSHYNINSLNGDNGSWTIEFDSDRYINCEWQMEQIRDYIISKHKKLFRRNKC